MKLRFVTKRILILLYSGKTRQYMTFARMIRSLGSITTHEFIDLCSEFLKANRNSTYEVEL